MTTDRYGFPLKTCGRCGGSGKYSYNPLDGDRCYGCGGSGWQHATKKAAAAFSEFREAQRRAARPIASAVEVGDEITFDHSKGASAPSPPSPTPATPAPGSVLAIAATTPARTSSLATYLIFRYTDGTEEKVASNIARRRGRKVDPAPYLEQAGA